MQYGHEHRRDGLCTVRPIKPEFHPKARRLVNSDVETQRTLQQNTAPPAGGADKYATGD